MRFIHYRTYEERLDRLRRRFPEIAEAADHPLNRYVIERACILWRRDSAMRACRGILVSCGISGVNLAAIFAAGVTGAGIAAATLGLLAIPPGIYVGLHYFRRKRFERMYDPERQDMVGDQDVWLAGYDYRRLAGLGALKTLAYAAHPVLRVWRLGAWVLASSILMAIGIGCARISVALFVMTSVAIGSLVGNVVVLFTTEEIRLLNASLGVAATSVKRRRPGAITLDEQLGTRALMAWKLVGFILFSFVAIIPEAVAFGGVGARGGMVSLITLFGVSLAISSFQIFLMARFRGNFRANWNAIVEDGVRLQTMRMQKRNETVGK